MSVHEPEQHAHAQERKPGENARNQREHRQHQQGKGQHLQHIRLQEKLLRERYTKTFLFRGTSNQNTCCGGDHQRRDLRNQAITNTENGVGLQRLRHLHVALQHADTNAANDIHQRDDDTGDCITAHKLTGTIHGAIEIRFLGKIIPPFTRLILLDQPGIQLGINSHLLAGHGIQSKAGRHFSNTTGALGNDHKIDDRENDEDHKAHHIIILYDHFTEFLNDLARLRLPKNQPSGGNI